MPATRDFSAAVKTAILSRHIPALQTLLDRGAAMTSDPDMTKNPDNQEPLHIAIRTGDHAVITWLLEHGAAVNAVDNMGRTAAHMAARDEPLLRVLVGVYGADIHVQDSRGNPPLAEAAHAKDADAFTYLLSFYDLSTFKPAQEDMQWYAHALSGAQCPVIITFLLDRLDIERYGEEVLLRTYTSHNIALLEALVSRGVSLNARFPTREAAGGRGGGGGGGGGTILHRYALRPLYTGFRDTTAIERAQVAAASFVLERRPEGVHDVDEAGNTPLHVAARTHFRRMVRMLLERGASATVGNFEGVTPVEFGRNSSRDVFELLKACSNSGEGLEG